MRLLTFNAFKNQVQKLTPNYREEIEIHSINLTESEFFGDVTILYTASYSKCLVEYETSGNFYFHGGAGIIGVGRTFAEAKKDHETKLTKETKWNQATGAITPN